ncbi:MULTISPECIES: urease accessory protein UreE [unclassified Chelatococcus]|uniref:urease accessory protein UreE n=1 Tax=unclassified Chelatococcus TaxID=2638111 RepID=UPI001BCDED7B|nr:MULTISPECIES: urease accessory protein UreE [unclassified Chelatococcus]MBS7698895.1 urease accessory protein UreE [Chelatococcus sp. YT9]MBX3559529.1 urease accessory protein UreE [Chelatococcus sp.]
MLRAIALRRASEDGVGHGTPFGQAVLPHDERHLRRRVIELADGQRVLVDLPETVVLSAGDTLVIEGGGTVEIAAANEALYAVRGKNPIHITELAWHIGNRHLAAAIEDDRILILRDHVIKAMLEGLGAEVEEVEAEFNPVRGAYSGHNHERDHSHRHNDDHGHSDHHHDHEHVHTSHHSHSHAHASRDPRHDR